MKHHRNHRSRTRWSWGYRIWQRTDFTNLDRRRDYWHRSSNNPTNNAPNIDACIMFDWQVAPENTFQRLLRGERIIQWENLVLDLVGSPSHWRVLYKHPWITVCPFCPTSKMECLHRISKKWSAWFSPSAMTTCFKSLVMIKDDHIFPNDRMPTWRHPSP